MKYLATLLLIFGFGLSGFGQTIKSLGYNTTNGQVVANTGTNVLTFTNRPLLKGVDTTNIPTLFWQTSDGVGDGAMLAFSRRHATNLWFGINQTNWSQGAWGQNIQPTADGNNFTRKNTNIGSVALVLENEYNAEQNTNTPPRTVAEMYFDVTDIFGQRFRPLMFVGSQTNSALGWGYSAYPFTVGITNLGWNAASAFQVDYNNPSGGGTMVLKNLSTSGGSYAELQMVSGGGTALILQKQNRFDLYANNVSYGNIIQALTNGVVIGSSSFKTVADARVQLGGDTRIDGAISFDSASNAATTRTNLGFSTNLNTLWTATTASNARSAVELGNTNSVSFGEISINNGKINWGGGSPNGLRFFLGTNEAFRIIDDGIHAAIADGKFRGSLDGSVNLGSGQAITFKIASQGIIFEDANAKNITLTNLGLGGGITATNTFVSYNGTNYTTNTVTISNGIITGWTQ